MEAGPRSQPGRKTDTNREVLKQQLEGKFVQENRAPEPPAIEMPKEVVIELDGGQITALNLILTRKQLAEAETKLALIRLKEAQAALIKTSNDEAIALARIAAANKLPGISNVRAIAQNKISCKVP